MYLIDTKTTQCSILAAFCYNFKFIASWRNTRAQDLHNHGLTSAKCQQVNTFLAHVFNNKWKLRSKGVKLAIHETLVGDSQE